MFLEGLLEGRVMSVLAVCKVRRIALRAHRNNGTRLMNWILVGCFLLVFGGAPEPAAGYPSPGSIASSGQGEPTQESEDSKPDDQWEEAISEFERKQAESPAKRGSVLFTGSSSIRLWDLEHAFPEQRFVNRGFGGSTLRDLIRYAPRIFLPVRPRLIVIYSGDNDLAEGLTPREVAADFATLVAWIDRELPETMVISLAIKPSQSRWELVHAQREANRRIEAICAADPGLRYVDVAACLLADDGRPNPDYFDEDQLHLSEAGYALWTTRLQEVLREVDRGRRGESRD